MRSALKQLSYMGRVTCLSRNVTRAGFMQMKRNYALAQPMTRPADDSLNVTNLKEGTKSKVTVVIGAQWGDEGKGKIVDHLALNSSIVCRCQGGSNAEHAVVADGQVYHFRLLPVGFLNKNALCVIGNGVVVHAPYLLQELEAFEKLGHKDWAERVIISDRAHMVFDFHQDIDVLQELQRQGQRLGTIKKGVGPAYSSKVFRSGIRFGDLAGDFGVFSEKFSSLVNVYQSMFPGLKVNVAEELAVYEKYAEKLRPVIKDTLTVVHKALDANQSVLVEGANASMLDIDFGTYPFVTSSNTSVGGVCTGLGIPPGQIGDVFGVIKSYTARYGTGPFPTHLDNPLGDFFEANEIVTPPARKIRCGWIDLVAINYTHRINGYSAFALTKLDTLDTLDTIKVGVGYKLDGKSLDYYPSREQDLNRVEVDYVTLPGWLSSTEGARSWEELPEKAKDFVRCIEKYTGVGVKWVGVGREREALITRF